MAIVGDLLCDRCGKEIPRSAPCLKLHSTEHVLRDFPPHYLLELCEPCGVALIAWVGAKQMKVVKR